MTAYDNFWQLMTAYDNLWQLMTTYDKLWRLMTTFDSLRQPLTTFDSLWQLTFYNFLQLLTTFYNFLQLFTTYACTLCKLSSSQDLVVGLVFNKSVYSRSRNQRGKTVFPRRRVLVQTITVTQQGRKSPAMSPVSHDGIRMSWLSKLSVSVDTNLIQLEPDEMATTTNTYADNDDDLIFEVGS